MKIDAHHHYWDPKRGDYPWMEGAPDILIRSYGPADLQPHLNLMGITSTVVVQAAPTLAETFYLLSLAEATPSIGAVVGWVDLLDSNAPNTLDALARLRWFRGVRPMLQDIDDTHWILKPETQEPLNMLARLGGVFDALGLVRHLDVLAELADRHPDLTIVLNHALKPEIANNNYDDWAKGMQKLAGKNNVSCKISGLMTEAGPDATVVNIRPYVQHLIDIFGADRLMFGSDWPVMRLATEYPAWCDMVDELVSELSSSQRGDVWGNVAQRIYQIDSVGTPLLQRS